MPLKVPIWVYEPKQGLAEAQREPRFRFLEFLPPETTVGETFIVIERRVKEQYLDPKEWSHFVIKNLRDKDDNDLDTHLTLELLSEGTPPTTIIKVETAATDRGLSIPINSTLRPLTHHDADIRRSLSNPFSSVRTDRPIHPDEPLRSSEQVDIADELGAATSVPDSQPLQPPEADKPTKSKPRNRRKPKEKKVVEETSDDEAERHNRQPSVELDTTSSPKKTEKAFKKPLTPKVDKQTTRKRPGRPPRSVAPNVATLEKPLDPRSPSDVTEQADSFPSLQQTSSSSNNHIAQDTPPVSPPINDVAGPKVITQSGRYEQLKATRRLSGLESDLDAPPRPKTASGVPDRNSKQNSKQPTKRKPSSNRRNADYDDVTTPPPAKRARTVPPNSSEISSRQGRARSFAPQPNQEYSPNSTKTAVNTMDENEAGTANNVFAIPSSDIQPSEAHRFWIQSLFETSKGTIQATREPPYSAKNIQEAAIRQAEAHSSAKQLSLQGALKGLTDMVAEIAGTPNTEAKRQVDKLNEHASHAATITDLADALGTYSEKRKAQESKVSSKAAVNGESLATAIPIAKSTSKKSKLAQQSNPSNAPESPLAGKMSAPTSVTKANESKTTATKKGPKAQQSTVESASESLAAIPASVQAVNGTAAKAPPKKLTSARKAAPKTSSIRTSLKGKGRAVITPEPNHQFTDTEVTHEVGKINEATNGAGPSKAAGQQSPKGQAVVPKAVPSPSSPSSKTQPKQQAAASRPTDEAQSPPEDGTPSAGESTSSSEPSAHTPTPPKSSAVTQPSRSSPLTTNRTAPQPQARGRVTSGSSKTLQPVVWSNVAPPQQNASKAKRDDDLQLSDDTSGGESDGDEEESVQPTPKKAAKAEKPETSATPATANAPETKTPGRAAHIWSTFTGSLGSMRRSNKWLDVPDDKDDEDDEL